MNAASRNISFQKMYFGFKILILIDYFPKSINILLKLKNLILNGVLHIILKNKLNNSLKIDLFSVFILIFIIKFF